MNSSPATQKSAMTQWIAGNYGFLRMVDCRATSGVIEFMLAAVLSDSESRSWRLLSVSMTICTFHPQSRKSWTGVTHQGATQHRIVASWRRNDSRSGCCRRTPFIPRGRRQDPRQLIDCFPLLVWSQMSVSNCHCHAAVPEKFANGI